MINNHESALQSELSVFVRSPKGKLYASTKACASLVHTDSISVKKFAEELGVEPQVEVKVHLADDIITLGLFNEKFLLDLLKSCQVEAAPTVDDSVLLSYLYFSSGFNSKIVDQALINRLSDSSFLPDIPDEDQSFLEDTEGHNGITLADIKLICQSEEEE